MTKRFKDMKGVIAIVTTPFNNKTELILNPLIVSQNII